MPQNSPWKPTDLTAELQKRGVAAWRSSATSRSGKEHGQHTAWNLTPATAGEGWQEFKLHAGTSTLGDQTVPSTHAQRAFMEPGLL